MENLRIDIYSLFGAIIACLSPLQKLIKSYNFLGFNTRSIQMNT